MSLEDIKKSAVWDEKYNLPLVPKHNNPWIYGAYIYALLGEPKELLESFAIYYARCFNKEYGRLSRWPDGSGGRVSHDELIGAAYLFPEASSDILHRLDDNDGIYNDSDSVLESMYRFIFLVPFLRQAKGVFVSLQSQVMYCLHLLISCIGWKKESGSSGALMIWLMNRKMKKLWLCWIFIQIYEKIMEKKGCTLDWCLKEHFWEYPEVVKLL